MSATVLREIRLYGVLGREFGRVFRLAVATPGEAVHALRAVLPGFERVFLGRDGRAAYHVFVGRKVCRRSLTKEELCEPLGAADPIMFVPVIAGAKRAGTAQVILGAVIFAVSAYFNFAPGMSLGLSLMLGGAIQLLSPQTKKEPTMNARSSIFDGPINNAEQGGPVPVRYGRAMVGSTVVSQGISTQQLAAPAGPAIASNLVNLPDYEPDDPNVDRGAP